MTLPIPDPQQAMIDLVNDLKTRVTSLERAPWNDQTGNGGVLATGDIIAAFGPTRAGCLLCDGSTFANADHPALAAYLIANVPSLIVDGSNTKVPDYRGQSLAGAGGGGFSLGVQTGVAAVTLTSAQSGVPAHTHGAGAIATSGGSAHTHTGSAGNESATHTHTVPSLVGDFNSISFAAGGSAAASVAGTGTGASHYNVNPATLTGTENANHTHTITIGNESAHTHTVTIPNNTAADASSPHTNIPPTLPANIFIKT